MAGSPTLPPSMAHAQNVDPTDTSTSNILSAARSAATLPALPSQPHATHMRGNIESARGRVLSNALQAPGTAESAYPLLFRGLNLTESDKTALEEDKLLLTSQRQNQGGIGDYRALLLAASLEAHDTPKNRKITGALSQSVYSPVTNEIVSKNALRRRQKVVDPETGETVSKAALAQRQKVLDPETGEIISKNALALRQKVVDPETGETISKGALVKRKKIVDPETGEAVSKNALALRQKVVDPETGETVKKAALAQRQKVVDPETGETIRKSALAKRQKKRQKISDASVE